MSNTTHAPAVLRLSRSEGGYQNTRLLPFEIDFSALCEALNEVSVGPKDGAYFVRGPCLPTRADSNLPFADVVIIDGDKRVDPGTGAIEDTGAPHPSLAHEALRELSVPHAIFTTHSHQPNRFRWRAVIPCHCPDQETLKAVVDHLIDRLHDAGCFVANAFENGHWSQAWYFPRIASAESEFIAYSHEDDAPLTPEQIGEIVAAWRATREATAPSMQAAGHRASEYDPSTPIGRFIAGHDNPEYIGGLLEKHGYVFRHHATTNGRPAYRFTWPGSTSGVPGVHLFSGQGNGRWLTYSHHPEDPLHGKVRDVFGLFQLLEHGDDQSKAVAEWARQEEREQDDQPGPKGRYRLLTPEELSGLPPIEWRVKGLLPAVALCALFGPSGSGKSFLVLDLVAAVARGLPDWHGHRVRPSPVIYCALEGETGIKHRIQAYMKANECELPDHLRFVLQPFDLTDQDDRQALLEAIHAEGLERPIIVLDTLSRATPGLDENSSKDMSLVVEGADEIKRSLQGLVLLVHHTGKDEGRGPRGHSSLKADFDGLITVTHDEARGRCWSASKVKDGELGEAHWFELEKVHLYDDADGDPVDSCVIRPVAAGAESKAWCGKPMPPSVRYGVDTLHSAIRESGEDGSVHVDQWRRVFYAGHTADSTAAKKVAFQRVRKELIDGSAVSVKDDVYTLLDGSGASWPDSHGYIQTLNLAAQWRRKCA